jgi:NAD-dependent SIR2 family protein deacetylase
MCNCQDHADLVMVHGRLKVYRCTVCGREWEEKETNDTQGE